MRTRQASKAGFTLIEMIVVVMVLALVAAMIAPSLSSMKATSDTRSMLAGARRFASAARERAIRLGTTTQLLYDESQHELQIQDVADDGTATTAMHQALTTDLEPQNFQIEGKDSTATDFKLIFTPDGRSDGGGIEFHDFSIVVDQNGAIRTLDGQLPAPGDQTWGAGDLEQRQP